ncbi:MAG: flagellar biosynthetic protein FliO [Turneriella sp.]|nr:flagellar biosynthetic protein FliO [Turneriella sp.]
MRRWISTVLISVFLAAGTLTAQENATPKSETKEQTSATETKTKPAETKPDPLADFEKQLQKELEGTPDRPANSADQPSVLWQFIRTLLTLAFLLAIFYGIFRIYKFKREMPAQNFSAVSSIYEFPLGTNQRLQIVEIAGKLMILGVSEQSIQLISEVTDKYTIDRIKLDCAEDSKAPKADFLTALSTAIKTNLAERFGKKKPDNFSLHNPGSAGESLEAQRQSSMERLRKLKSDKYDWRDKQ